MIIFGQIPNDKHIMVFSNKFLDNKLEGHLVDASDNMNIDDSDGIDDDHDIELLTITMNVP